MNGGRQVNWTTRRCDEGAIEKSQCALKVQNVVQKSGAIESAI